MERASSCRCLIREAPTWPGVISPQRRGSSPRSWLWSYTLTALVLLLVLAGCGSFTPGGSDIYEVTFSTGTAYDDALLLVTDVGLQLASSCEASTRLDPSGTTVFWAPWYPRSQRQNYEAAGAVHLSLSVLPTTLAPSDWIDRLRKLPEVHIVQPAQVVSACTIVRISATPPTADENDLLPPSQIGIYAHLTFPPSTIYGAALDAVTNLGLRLADPCYEQARATGKSPPWHPMGQEDTFAGSQTFLVATTVRTSTRWRDQVQALPATAMLAPDATSQCWTR